MPHKHKRRTTGDGAQYNLPPNAKARALPAFENDAKQRKGKQNSHEANSRNLKRKRETKSDYRDDDTPRAFARLMQLQQTGKKVRSGLDNGERTGKAKKKSANMADAKQKDTGNTKARIEVAQASTAPRSSAEVPKIMPGERLSDYAARVNRALPVSGLARKGRQNIEGVKERRTKTEKRLHKMYAEWREEDEKRKAREEEFAEQQEEEDEEKAAALGVESLEVPMEGKRTKRKRMLTEANDAEEDPWAVLREKRGKVSKGLHDVVQEPPTLKPVREKFKMKAGAGVDVVNIPKSAGSLKKREELSSTRREIIERYRAMMKGGGI